MTTTDYAAAEEARLKMGEERGRFLLAWDALEHCGRALTHAEARQYGLMDHAVEVEKRASDARVQATLWKGRTEYAEQRMQELEAIVRQVEWAVIYAEDGKCYCPLCDQVEYRGHSPDCPIAAILAERERDALRRQVDRSDTLAASCLGTIQSQEQHIAAVQHERAALRARVARLEAALGTILAIAADHQWPVECACWRDVEREAQTALDGEQQQPAPAQEG